MALIGRLIGQLLKRGSITIVYPDGKRATYGPGGGKTHYPPHAPIARCCFELVRNPRLGLGEAYMDERLIDRRRDNPRPV